MVHFRKCRSLVTKKKHGTLQTYRHLLQFTVDDALAQPIKFSGWKKSCVNRNRLRIGNAVTHVSILWSKLVGRKWFAMVKVWYSSLHSRCWIGTTLISLIANIRIGGGVLTIIYTVSNMVLTSGSGSWCHFNEQTAEDVMRDASVTHACHLAVDRLIEAFSWATLNFTHHLCAGKLREMPRFRGPLSMWKTRKIASQQKPVLMLWL